MLSLRHKYTIRIGTWTLAQWLKFTVILLSVVVAAVYITRDRTKADQSDRSGVLVNSQADVNFIAEVVSVTDGDTIEISGVRGHQKVRLNGIDCPEKGQPFAESARLLTMDLALHKQFSVKVKGRDKYGRIIADLVFLDGRVLNRELVKTGMAWWYRQYSKDDQLAALEHDARTRRIGLWADAEPVAPWQFRNRNGK